MTTGPVGPFPFRIKPYPSDTSVLPPQRLAAIHVCLES
jgi:hypothetical protein